MLSFAKTLELPCYSQTKLSHGEKHAKMQQPRNFLELLSSFSFQIHQIPPTLQAAILESDFSPISLHASRLSHHQDPFTSLSKINKQSPQTGKRVKREQGGPESR
jgi:hypothetical protein